VIRSTNEHDINPTLHAWLLIRLGWLYNSTLSYFYPTCVSKRGLTIPYTFSFQSIHTILSYIQISSTIPIYLILSYLPNLASTFTISTTYFSYLLCTDPNKPCTSAQFCRIPVVPLLCIPGAFRRTSTFGHYDHSVPWSSPMHTFPSFTENPSDLRMHFWWILMPSTP
jgi:hypothetical protein